MKAWILSLLPSVAFAGQVFDGYDAYHTTLPAPLFKAGDRIELQSYGDASDGKVKLHWAGKVRGKSRQLTLEQGVARLDGHSIRLSTARVFPGEVVDVGDLGMGTEAFFGKDYLCLQNTPATASGTAVRHKAIYLIETRRGGKVLKLPSLFASCLGLRQPGKWLEFDKVAYRYAAAQDAPIGVSFTRVRLQNGAFIQDAPPVMASFVEPDNVYRFSLDHTPQ